MDAPHTEPIYENTSGDAEELERSIRVCMMGNQVPLPLTCAANFRSGATFSEIWNQWRQTLFAGVLAPHVLDAFRAAQKNDVKQLVELDRALDGQLQTDAADRSVTAREHLHALVDGARHVKSLVRLLQAVERQEIRGHHATFFACEGAMFNVPLMHLLPAFLFAEWRSARANAGVGLGDGGSDLKTFEFECGDAMVQARQILISSGGRNSALSVCA